jgi:hypothetical protein
MELPKDCCASCKHWTKDTETHGICALIEIVHEDAGLSVTGDAKSAYCDYCGGRDPVVFTGEAFCCNRFERTEQGGSTDEKKTECQPFDPYDL